MGKIDASTAPTRSGSRYPAPFDATGRNKRRVRLGAAAGLTRIGVNRLELEPGCWSSQRHWHERVDEFVLVLEGEVVLVTDAGEETLRAGEAAGFPAGDPNGHHLINRGERTAVVLEIGGTDPDDVAHYPDVDLLMSEGAFRRKSGEPYPPSAS